MLAILQAAEGVASPWATLGVGGGITGLVLFLWDRDRKEHSAAYQKLAEDFRLIVQENTKAIQSLTDALVGEVTARDAIKSLRRERSGGAGGA